MFSMFDNLFQELHPLDLKNALALFMNKVWDFRVGSINCQDFLYSGAVTKS